MSPLINSPNPDLNPEIEAGLTDGFDILELIRMMWAAGMNPDFVATATMEVIRHPVAPKPYWLYITIAILIGNKNWMQYDVAMLSDPTKGFKISVVAWAFVVGPRDLALGWKNGYSTLDILLDREKSWITKASTAHIAVDKASTTADENCVGCPTE